MHIAWAAGLVLAGCLQVVPDVAGPGQTSVGGGSSSGTGNTGSTGGTATSGMHTTSGTTTGSGTGGCDYPTSAGGNLFPYSSLGDGWLDLNGVPDVNTLPSHEPQMLLQLHCTAERYALIVVTTAWDPHSPPLAKELPTYTTAWLAQGGVILMVLEQGQGGGPATQKDLTDWATEYGANYSLVNDPAQAVLGGQGNENWPALFIVRLSDMQIVNSQYGPVNGFLGSYAVLLAETFDGGQ